MSVERPEVLVVAPVMPFLMDALRGAVTVHDRLHLNDPSAFAAAAPRIRAVVATGESKVPAALIAQLPALEMITVFGVGYDGVDVAAARARGIPVTHTPGVLNDDVADLALGLLISAARRIPQADRFVRGGEWLKGPIPVARKVAGSRLGVVGMGRIGQAIAQRALAFRMDVAYTARSPRENLPYTYHPDAASLAAAVDFLVVITPGGAATRGLIDAKVLQALGPQGYLVNVARGSVVDQPALIAALQAGTIAGAALDVFADEPHVPAELLAMDNVVLTPHIGSGTRQTREAMAQLTFDNLRAHFAGEPLLTPVPA
ncbi:MULTISPECIES: 2-hydroxyacid dehydrogenase [unclassified Variovorax]|uniref:2-hydroxyacid dehydrogenase n=1 Tax=unclassified Variovorax TaxID=663243 RepID=UPI002575513A|nr:MULTISPECIES: 2-hydroxyacid dehydrogenase [unclassified Variovorax]MDM0087347.1 2-hydroxyacid dehydrogenase [Variovorax sp. J22G40]MDM0144396.1 2-hydroxyacid dehydrogenase [Variovorax sp. J2P1-31]